jgi:anti-anti-sigma factor
MKYTKRLSDGAKKSIFEKLMALVREYPDCYIIDMPERIVKGTDSAVIRKTIESHAEKGRHLALNFAPTAYIDSTIVTIILNTDRLIKKAGKKLFIIRPSEAILEILNITSIARIIPILDSDDPLIKRQYD